MTLQEYPSGKLAAKAMFAGEVDIATVADMPVVFNSWRWSSFRPFTPRYPLPNTVDLSS
ncbi:MAG: hypothetical protein GY801_05870 [bacterium]|nr:hypothetical protein [bacterium]